MPCVDCKFWEKLRDSAMKDLPEFSDTPTGVRRCANAVEMWEASEWVDVGEEIVRRLKPQYANHKSFTQDGSGYKAFHLTRYDFHCIDHQPTEPAP